MDPLSSGIELHRGFTPRSSSVHLPTSSSKSFTATLVRHQGQQGFSIKSAASAGIKLADNIVYGNNSFHFANDSSTLDKAATVIGHGRLAGGVIHSLAQLGSTTGAIVDGASGFMKSFQVLKGIGLASDGLAFFKEGARDGWQAIKDIASHKKRGETQQLIQQWQAESGRFSGSAKDEQRLRELSENKGVDLTRSRGKTALDHLTNLKDLAVRGLGITSSSLVLAEQASSVAAKALPGVAIAASSIAAIQSGIRSGIQIAALNNLSSAVSKTDDGLIKALAGHIKHERTINARKNLIQTGVNVAGVGVSAALAASAAGAPAALIAAGALSTATAISTMAFEGLHNRKLAKAREQARQLLSLGHPLQSIAKSNIGVAERAFLMRLRSSQGQDLKTAVVFLRDLGVTENTIKKLQLAPEGVALKTLQQTLYKDKLKFKGLMLKQTGKTLLHVSGLTTLGKKIKAGHQWLSGKLFGLRQTHIGLSVKHPRSPLQPQKILAFVTEPVVFTEYKRRHF